MAKRTYVAKFSNGHERSRSSARAYTHAWRWETDRSAGIGFASSRELAERALDGDVKRFSGGERLTFTQVVEVAVR